MVTNSHLGNLTTGWGKGKVQKSTGRGEQSDTGTRRHGDTGKVQDLKLGATVAIKAMFFHHRVIEDTEKIRIWVNNGCHQGDVFTTGYTGFHWVNLHVG